MKRRQFIDNFSREKFVRQAKKTKAKMVSHTQFEHSPFDYIDRFALIVGFNGVFNFFLLENLKKKTFLEKECEE